MRDDYALEEIKEIRSNCSNRLKQARAAHDDHMTVILGRRVSALDAAIAALERQRVPIKAKPIEWEHHIYPGGGQDWTGSFGFVVEYDPEEDLEFRYSAVWGEEVENFGALAEAQKWCQGEADGLVAEMAAAPEPEDKDGRD